MADFRRDFKAAVKDDALDASIQVDEHTPLTNARLSDAFNDPSVQAKRVKLDQTDEELGLQSGSVSGRMLYGQALDIHNRQVAMRVRGQRGKSDIDTLLFLLEAQIAALQAQIDALDEQISATEDLIEILDSGEEIDPTDPDHIRLLKAAGIPEDQWGTVTREQLDERLEELKAERDRTQQEYDDVKTHRDRVYSTGASDADVREEARDQIYEVRRDMLEDDAEWLELSTARVLSLTDDVEKINSEIDRLIDVVSYDIVMQLRDQDDIDPMLLTRLDLRHFEEIYLMLQEDVDDPQYETWLKELIEELGEDAHRTLQSTDGLPEDAREILNDMYGSVGASLTSTP